MSCGSFSVGVAAQRHVLTTPANTKQPALLKFQSADCFLLQ
ncbi:hypothetical protein QG071_05730 [Kingella kingae]|nr:hypothetical protein [Kingella kingae]MDK4555008.1 hypothetical protein [Kingella kingae]MDK4576387.1 hypothetical protein [Kingella kingae]MDK4582434.1 hypothetical protein [Kingella kingae]MDK4584726.1 hypothetical protein [Kingella kingae]MDK4588088.1 hypothetical protein [Kingella kingae]